MNSFMPFVEDSYPVDHEILEFYSDHFSPNSFNSQSIESMDSIESIETSPISATKQIKKRHQQNWKPDEDKLLIKLHKEYNGKWGIIANQIEGRNASQCCQRFRRLNPTLIRKKWSAYEDELLIKLVKKYGKQWSKISEYFSSNISGKQIRERYINTLDGRINKNKWTEEEDQIILTNYLQIGSTWSFIARCLQNRTENQVKNRFYGSLKKRMI